MAQTATDVTSKITDPSFEDNNKAKKWSGDFGKAPNTSLVGIDGSIYYEKWTDSKNKLGNLTEEQTITLPKGYYELTAVGSMLDQSLAEDKQDGAKGFFLKAGDNAVEFGKVGTYCVPFSMDADGNVVIGVYTNNAQGNWARVDNFQLVSYDISGKCPNCGSHRILSFR